MRLKDIVEVSALEGYHVRLRFEDGVVGEYEIKAGIHQNSSDQFPSLCWR